MPGLAVTLKPAEPAAAPANGGSPAGAVGRGVPARSPPAVSPPDSFEPQRVIRAVKTGSKRRINRVLRLLSTFPVLFQPLTERSSGFEIIPCSSFLIDSLTIGWLS